MPFVLGAQTAVPLGSYYDTVGIIMDAYEAQIMGLIKERSKASQLTQRMVAEALSVSLPTVKRWWAGRGISIATLHRLCSLLGVSLAQLLQEVDARSSSYQCSLEQEKMLAAHPKVLALFDLLVSGEKISSIQRKASLSESAVTAMLLKLDRVGLIELHPGNKVRLKRKGEPQWIVDGPLSKLYRKQMIESLLGTHPRGETAFYIHDYLPDDLQLLKGKLKELESLMLACNSRGSLQPEKARSYGVYMCLKEFEWSLRRELVAR